MKTLKTLTLTVAAIGLSAGAVQAGDMTSASSAGVNSQTETQANLNVPSSPNIGIDAGVNVSANNASNVEEVQASLKSEGYPVAVDGVWGPQTEQALRQFQQANNLDVSGQINAETMAALGDDASASQTRANTNGSMSGSYNQ